MRRGLVTIEEVEQRLEDADAAARAHAQELRGETFESLNYPFAIRRTLSPARIGDELKKDERIARRDYRESQD